MNRKLHNTMLALSTTGLALVAGLLLATPLFHPPVDGGNGARVGITILAQSPDNAVRLAELDARTRDFESEMRHVTEPGQAITRTATFVAEVASDAALAAVLNQIESASATSSDTTISSPARISKRTRRSPHSAFATPYFSFARGLRVGNGA